ARFEFDFSEQSTRAENQLFPSERMGRSGKTRAGILLSGVPGGVYANPPALFQRPRADRDVLDGWIGHPNDYGLAGVPAGMPALLYLRQYAPRKPRCPCGASRGQRLQPAV